MMHEFLFLRSFAERETPVSLEHRKYQNMKKILLGITGGIAAYKTPDLIRKLLEANFEVRVVLTKNATQFVSLLTLNTLLPNSVFETLLESEMQHIKLAKWADTIVIAPATANVIAKLTYGFADDLLTCICLATTAPVFLVPAMNKEMWQHLATQHNVKQLEKRGVTFLGPDSGSQACGDVGVGRMLEPIDIVQYLSATTNNPFLKDIKILITAGATREAIDPARFISNKSSGKMGYALAHEAYLLGAQVTLISGKTSLQEPPCHRFIQVESAAEMLNSVTKEIANQNIFISAAAVSDFTVAYVPQQKIKRSKETLTFELVPTVDILATVCAQSIKPFTVGFAAETENIFENAKQKRLRKGADLIVVNDVSQVDIGFESNDNAVSVISEKEIIHLKKNSKRKIAQQLLKIIFDQYHVVMATHLVRLRSPRASEVIN